MKQFFDIKFNRIVYEILAGELVITKSPNSVLSTLLGSCVCLCMADHINGVYGMNHFMLPGNPPFCQIKDAKYGAYATDLLIKKMVDKGADKRYLVAKVFGAGKVLESSTINVARSNAEFIHTYLGGLKIPVLASDLGKDYGRKILFFCGKGEVYVKKIIHFSSMSTTLKQEARFCLAKT